MKSRSRLYRILNRNPPLKTGYGAEDFSAFMKEETYFYCANYCKNNIVIHNAEQLIELSRNSGALLTPMHYGSFFLAGGAIKHILKHNYTAIVTGRNIADDPDVEHFWDGVRLRSSVLYGQPLFYTGKTPVRSMLSYLKKPGNLLGAVLDVRENNYFPQEYPFDLSRKTVYLQTGPAKLAYTANVPLIPMVIQYNNYEKKHHLFFFEAISPCKNHVDVTQQALHAMQDTLSLLPEQWFYDIFSVFKHPHQAV